MSRLLIPRRIICQVTALLALVAAVFSAAQLALAIELDEQAHTEEHPRLYIDSKRVTELATQIETPQLQPVWRELKAAATAQAEAIVAGKSISQDMLRWHVDRAPRLYIAYLLTGDELYLRGALTVLDSLVDTEDWFGNNDRKAALALFSMCLGYDWLHPYLDESRRLSYSQAIATHADLLHRVVRDESMAWVGNYLSNHNHTNAMAIGVAGYTLLGEHPEAGMWLDYSRANFLTVLDYLSPDGAYAEGVGYWSGSVASLLKYALAVAPVYGMAAIEQNPYFRNTAKFRLHASLPGFHANVDYADSPRYDYHGPEYLLRSLSGIFADPGAEWLAGEIAAGREKKKEPGWTDILWSHQHLTPKAPAADTTFALFENLGLFFARTSWEKDASWAFFKAGPPYGWNALRKDYIRGGHIHPDQGQILYFFDGEWVLVDDGYMLKKKTGNHNVIEINGEEQLGGGFRSYKKDGRIARNPPGIVKYDLQGDYQYLLADLGGAYKMDDLIDQLHRSFIFLGDGTLVVHDRLQASESLSLVSRLHSAASLRKITDGMYCFGSRGNGRLSIYSGSGPAVKSKVKVIDEADRKSHAREKMYVIELAADTVSEFSSTFVFYRSDDDCAIADEPEVTWKGDQLVLNGQGNGWQVDLAAGKVTSMALPVGD